MKLKCNYCDSTYTQKMKAEGKKQTYSIDTENDDFIQDEKGKYYHTECYKLYLKNRKRNKLSNDEIEIKINELKQKQADRIKEMNEKDLFLKWIIDYYNAPVLPSYFMKKIQQVREGTYKGLNQEIDYATLLDIYQHMKTYLIKSSNKIPSLINNIEERMHYELAIVINNFGKYQRYKQKIKEENEQKDQSITKVLNEQQKIKDKKIASSSSDKFNLSDVIDDLLL